jgi:hypothetical protein
MPAFAGHAPDLTLSRHPARRRSDGTRNAKPTAEVLALQMPHVDHIIDASE